MPIQGGIYRGNLLVYDDDALNIITTIRIVDGVELSLAQKYYVNYIVVNFKRIGVWSKIRALYGFVGGTAATHKWNWKDMRNLNAAFRLTFPNGMTHSANGIQGNGTNQYANTFLASNLLSDNNISISCYISIAGTNAGTYVRSNSTPNVSLQSNMAVIPSSTNGVASYGRDQSKGFFLASKTSTSNFIVYKNLRAISISLSNNANSQRTATPFFIGAFQDAVVSGFSNAGFGLVSIGSGLTNTEAIQTSQIVTFAQSILNRA